MKLLSTIINVMQQQTRLYATKKPGTLTDAQIAFQKHTAELGFREKTSIKGTLYEHYDVETSKSYMKSQAFKEAYGSKYIWEYFVRNFKGRTPPSYTREKCVQSSRYTTGNPCPVCRDPYLVPHYTNLDLLRHFVSPHTGILLPTKTTNVCRKQQVNLQIAFDKACDVGLIEHYVPHREYNYSIYFPELANKETIEQDEEQNRLSVLAGIVLGANRHGINNILKDLKEEHIVKENHIVKE